MMIFPARYVLELTEVMRKFNEYDSGLKYDLLHKMIDREKVELSNIENEDKQVIELIGQLYNHGLMTTENRKRILEKLEELLGFLKKNNSFDMKDQKYEYLQYVITSIQQMLLHEKDYIDYTPGAQHHEYIRLVELIHSKEQLLVVNGKVLSFRNPHVYFDGKVIQGLRIFRTTSGILAEIVGEHYSTRDSIMEIYHNKKMTSASGNVFSLGIDPYCYIAEPGKLNNRPENYIRKMLGAAKADSFIVVKVIAPVHTVWIRVKEGCPAKFAIESRNLPIFPAKKTGFRASLMGDVRILRA